MKGNFFIRTIAGAVFTATVICSALLGEKYFALLFLFFAVVGLYEFYGLHAASIRGVTKMFGLMMGLFIYVLIFGVFNQYIGARWFWLLGISLPVWACIELLRGGAATAQKMSLTVFGWIYVILPFALLNVMAHPAVAFNHEVLIGTFVILWANDTGAYLIGRWLGKHTLMPSVSPNKTWEGLAGGVLLAMVVGFTLSQFFSSLNTEQWLFISVIIAIGGNLGDLLESKFKRDSDAKDSGQLIPGHGGVLDRFDGLLICAPIITVYIQLVS
ncbi:MAG: phosphatidate cytidylyltransferase [Flavobacteriales bacterium]